MTPYYEDSRAGIVIYHGDCREVLPVEADVLVTDPPERVPHQPHRAPQSLAPHLSEIAAKRLAQEVLSFTPTPEATNA